MSTKIILSNRLLGKEPLISSFILLSAFAMMGVVLITPALPKMAAYFNISIGSAQLTVTSFLLGYAAGQLLYGPLGNRFGRKYALYIGIGIATLGSLFSIISSPLESFHLLIVGRFLEALGASAGLDVCFTIINDFYFPPQARRITSILMLAFSIVPGLAILVGGIITEYLNWQFCFYFLLLYGLVLIYPIYQLPETITNMDGDALRYKYIIKNYRQIFTNKKLLAFAMISGFSIANIYVFGAEGPFIGIHLLHISPAKYGVLGLIPFFIGTLLGSLIVARLSRLEPILVLKLSFSLEMIAALFMLLFFSLHIVTLYTLLIPMTALCIAHPILAGTALSLSMQQTDDKSNGAAVMNFTVMSMPVIMTFLLGMLHIAQPWIMPLIFLVALGLMFLTYEVYIKRKN